MSQAARDSLKVAVDGAVETIELAECVTEGNHTFYARPDTEDAMVFEGVVVHNEYGLPDYFSADDIIIDIGAHIGSFSYAVLSRGAGMVHAYEAHPINCAIARKNLSRFGERAACRNLAVWRSDEPAKTLYNDVITGHTSGGISVLWNETGVPVGTISLDEILQEATNGLKKKVRLLKLDCEGSEYPILFTSKHLDVVEEICGEYHVIEHERIPEHAKVLGKCEYFNSSVLKSLLEQQGWVVELKPQSESDGTFHARREGFFIEPDGDAHTQDVNVEGLMRRVREAVARKEASGEISLVDISAALAHPLQHVEQPRSPLQLTLSQLDLEQELPYATADRYHVDDLLKYHDKDFVRYAYRALLLREADEDGFNHYLDSLRSGRLNKIDILAALRYSPEGQERNVPVEGLRFPSTLRRLYRIPALGYLLQLSVALLRLPVLARNHSQLEAYTFVQREKLVDSIKVVADSIERVAGAVRTVEGSIKAAEDSFKASIKAAEVSFATRSKLQHQQINALFREQQEILGEQKELFDLLSARHALEKERSLTVSSAALEEQVKQLSQRIEALRRELERQQAPATGAASSRDDDDSHHDNQALAGARSRLSQERHRLDALYASFEDEFRGDSLEVKERFRYYLPYLKQAGITGGILDIGCGRGDWLELLKEEGLEARAVDSNSVLVESCRRRGLSVTQEDALSALRGLTAGSLNAVTCFHVVEHLSFETMVELLDEIFRTLRPDGLLMLETPNPENLVVAASNFYADPTHNRPISPHTLKFIMQERGFQIVGFDFLHPVEGSPFTGEDRGARALHMWFYGPRDFALVGSKT